MDGIVLYTDGGARNTGAGSGIHGYAYSFCTPIRGTGNPTYTLTNKGYIRKADLKKSNEKTNLPKENDQDAVITESDVQKACELPHGTEVKVNHYIEKLITYPTSVTNNYAELYGMIESLRTVLDYEPTVYSAVIYCDSTYVIQGVTEWMEKWKLNGFRREGNPIPNAELWETVYDLYATVKQKIRHLELKWVKGHAGNYGNERADKLATTAITYKHPAGLNTPFVKNIESKAEGYWKADFKHHDLFNQRYILFNPALPNPEGVYVGVTLNDEVRYLGAASSETAYSVVHLTDNEYGKEYVALLNAIIRKQTESLDLLNVVCLLDTNVLYNKDVLSLYRTLDMEAFSINERKEVITYALESTGTVVCHVMNPAYLSYEAEARVREIYLLTELLESGKDIVGLLETDITELLYDDVYNKKGEATAVLKSDWVVGSRILECTVDYAQCAYSPPEKEQAELRMTFGQDIPERNTLKRLETLKPKVSVFTNSEVPYYFQYGVAVRTAVGNVFSMAGNSHSRFINPKRKQKNEN